MRIIFCNMNMPDHDGLWLIQRIQATWPTLLLQALERAETALTVLDAKVA